MKRIIVVMLLMTAILITVFGQKQGEARKSDTAAQQLKQFEGDWLTAILNGDKAWLEHFFAGESVVVPFENDAVKNRARETAELIDPKLKPEEMKVRITGNITVLTNSAGGTGGANRSYYFLDTFNKLGGKWQVIASHFSQNLEPEGENTEQAVIRMERELSAATGKKDVSALNRILADDFSGIESSGSVFDKAQTINDIASGVENVQSGTPENLKVKIYGDTAVATGRLSVSSKKNEGDYNLKMLFTDIWTKQNGQWQIVNHQATQTK